MADIIDLEPYTRKVEPGLSHKSLMPMGELSEIMNQSLREATETVEEELRIEDQGWINYSATGGDVITDSARKEYLKLSRLYYARDPLGKQSIRLWTDYTFGGGMTWSTEHDNAKDILVKFWNRRENKSILSASGQRKSSDKLLVDGEIFFAIFLGKYDDVKIRRIEPLEISEIITEPGDIDDVLYYIRDWSDRQGIPHTTIYRDVNNVDARPGIGSAGQTVTHNDEALVIHLAYNTITQRGNPLLLPALDWIKQYRRFLASRVAVMLALARFAWHTKIKGGQDAINTIRARTNEEEIAAGSILMENLAVDTKPIKTETGASAAYQDGRMLKLQVCAAVGIPEQYFGDISIGNLATAKTVELPMLKMFTSYQKVWEDIYKEINGIVLNHAKVPEDSQYVDMDFPPIAPQDVLQAAQAMVQILNAFPDYVYSPDVQQLAMMLLGVNDPAQAIEQIAKEAKSNPEAALARVLKQFRETLKKNGHDEGAAKLLPLTTE